MRFVLIDFYYVYFICFHVVHILFQGSYLAHTQGKKHQSNLARRAAQQAAEQPALPFQDQKPKTNVKKFVKIGRPGYKGLIYLHFFAPHLGIA